jgi:DNA-binding NarL/FixJ family response regulator
MIAGYSETRVALTPRMRDVLQAAALGQTAIQTADDLGLSESTVKTIRAALCARLRVHGLPAAVAAAYRLGLL